MIPFSLKKKAGECQRSTYQLIVGLVDMPNLGLIIEMVLYHIPYMYITYDITIY